MMLNWFLQNKHPNTSNVKHPKILPELETSMHERDTLNPTDSL